MSLPSILGDAAVMAACNGIENGIHGIAMATDAYFTRKYANQMHQKNIARFEECSEATNKNMDKLGELELEILKSLEKFSDVFEIIQNRPQFMQYSKDGVEIPEYDGDELKKVSIGADVLIGGLGGVALGTAGGFAAAGATKAAVMALGCASTGKKISELKGIAAKNATLAALGGGSRSTGGGGMELGKTMLNVSSASFGLQIGGTVFDLVGASLLNKAEATVEQANEAATEIERINDYLISLSRAAYNYNKSLESIQKIYKGHFDRLQWIIEIEEKTDWNTFTDKEKLLTENTVLLVGLLYKMCKVNLVLKSEDDTEMDTVNSEEISKIMKDAEQFVEERGFKIPA